MHIHPASLGVSHWKRPWCWERLRAGGEGGNGKWDSWMASLTQRTWIQAKSGRRWRTGKTCIAVYGIARSRIQLSDWTTTKLKFSFLKKGSGPEIPGFHPGFTIGCVASGKSSKLSECQFLYVKTKGNHNLFIQLSGRLDLTARSRVTEM